MGTDVEPHGETCNVLTADVAGGAAAVFLGKL